MLLRQGAGHLMALDRQILDRAQRLESRENSSVALPTEIRFPSAIGHRFVQDLDAYLAPLPQDFPRPIRLWTIIDQLENDIYVCRLNAHAQRCGSDARHLEFCPETAASLAGFPRRAADAEHAQSHRSLSDRSGRPPSSRVPSLDRRAAGPPENSPIFRLAPWPPTCWKLSMTIRHGRFMPKELFACSQNLEPRNAPAIAFCTWIISATKLGASCPLRIGEVTASFSYNLGDGEHVTCVSLRCFVKAAERQYRPQ